jgi:polyisoprenoid-binding protein YceI
MSTRLKVLSGIAIVVLGIGFAGFWFVIRDDSPPAPEIDAALAETETGAIETLDGAWVVTSDSIVGYQVKEVFTAGLIENTARGQTNEVTGEIVIAGTTIDTAAFTVDVASISSGEDRRDSQMRGRIMEVDQFPEASFTITEPIQLAGVPVDREEFTALANGDLTIHGVTLPVTVDLTVLVTGGTVQILGRIPILFSDYEINSPSIPAVTVEDLGALEFVIQAEKA